MGNSSEFKRAVKLVIENVSFEKNNTVQVFEVTIRWELYVICNCITYYIYTYQKNINWLYKHNIIAKMYMS